MTDQKQATAAVEPTIVPKLSIKTMEANGAIVLATKTRTPLVRVQGIANGIKVATGNDGAPVFGLSGIFRGTNIQTGKVYQSGVLYLPAGIGEMFISPLELALADDKRASMRLALDLFAVESTNKAGYSFEAESLIAGVNTIADLVKETEALPLPEMPKIAATKS